MFNGDCRQLLKYTKHFFMSIKKFSFFCKKSIFPIDKSVFMIFDSDIVMNNVFEKALCHLGERAFLFGIIGCKIQRI
jgi:hypothetical protein